MIDRDYGPGICEVCGSIFNKKSHSSLTCSDKCWHKRDLEIRKLRRQGKADEINARRRMARAENRKYLFYRSNDELDVPIPQAIKLKFPHTILKL